MKLSHKRLLAVISLGFVLILTGCQQEGAGEKAGKKVDQAIEKMGTKIEQTGDTIGSKVEIVTGKMDDMAITAKIKAEIFNDSLLRGMQIEVSTVRGVVTLSGVVNSQMGIDRALEIARGVEDVKAVETSLIVQG
ncbi:MAG: BON domain-containing protein [Desulforhopalus sp.]|nr:BON domain-containing protein [Desulforhopalus sp.]